MDRPRPTLSEQEAAAAQKANWHGQQRDLPIGGKFRILLKLQRLLYTMPMARGDKLEPWQKPWPIEP